MKKRTFSVILWAGVCLCCFSSSALAQAVGLGNQGSTGNSRTGSQASGLGTSSSSNSGGRTGSQQGTQQRNQTGTSTGNRSTFVGRTEDAGQMFGSGQGGNQGQQGRAGNQTNRGQTNRGRNGNNLGGNNLGRGRGQNGGQNGMQNNMSNGGSTTQRVIRPQLKVAFQYTQPQTEKVTANLTVRFEKHSSRIPVDNLEIAFENGKATLKGVVKSEEQRKLAVMLVRLEPGVREVQNELTLAQ